MRTQDVVAAVRRLIVVVAAASVLGAVAGGFLASRTAPSYTSEARLLFSVAGGNSATDLNQAATYLAREMTSYVQIATSDRVLDPAGQRLRPVLAAGDLAPHITVTNPTNTVLLSVVADAEQPEAAAERANAVAAEVSRTVQSLSPTMQNGAKTIQAGVIQTAKPPAASAGVSLPLGVGLGALVGLVLGVCGAVLLTSLDRKVRDSATLRQLVNAPLLASLEGGSDGRDTAEFRRAGAAIQRRCADAPALVGITSIGSASASDVAARLATAMREDGREVASLGVSDGGRWDTEGAAQQLSGAVTRDELRGCAAQAWPSADVILVVTPDREESAEIDVIADRVDFVLVVVPVGASRSDVRTGVASLREAVGGQHLGLILAGSEKAKPGR